MARQLTLEIAVEKTRAQQELRDLEQGLKNLEAAALKAGGATDKQAAAHENLSKRAATAKTAIRDLDAEKKKLTQSTDNQTKASGLLSAAVLRYASAGAVIAAVKWTADWADRLEELSKSTGISITMLQKLDQVTKLNGTSVEVLSKAFATMQDRVAGGDKSAVRAFDKLGIAFDAFQRMRPDDQIENLAIAVAKIENPMERANVVTDLFGKSGIALIPTLLEIAKGMDDMSVAAESNIRAMGQLSDWFEVAKGTGARLLVDLIGPLIASTVDLSGAATTLADRFAAFLDLISVGMPAPLAYLTGKLRELTLLMGGLSGEVAKMPGVPDAPTIFNADGTPGDVTINGDASDFDKRTKGYADVAMAEIARMRAQADVVKDAAKTAREESERAAQAVAAHFAQLDLMVSRAAQGASYIWSMGAGAHGWGMPAGGFKGAIDWTRDLGGNIGQGYAPNAMPAVQGADMSWYHNPQRPGFWRRQGSDLQGMQGSWRQQNFGSAEGWMNSAMGWGSQLQDISENGDPLVNATNVRGRGKRAVAGALKGAEVGGRFGGPYGAMGGALVGLIVGAFRNPAFEDVWNRIAKNFGVEVSDELAKRIADRAKAEFNNNRSAAEVRSLGDILGESGGLTPENISKMTARLHDAFSLKDTGVFSKKQLKETLDESFGYWAAYYNELGGVADKSMRDIVRLARESGAGSEAVAQYITEQVGVAASGLEMYLENATVKSQSAANGLAASMVLLFEETRRGPEGLRGALDMLGPMMLALDAQMQAAGLTGSEAFTAILADVKALEVEGVAAATTAVDGLTMTLEGLANSTLLNAEAFSGLSRAMTDEIEVARQALIAQGQDGDAAMRLNAAGLQTIWELQKEFGWAVDESTQAMLDQAEAQGLIGAQFQDVNKQMLDALLALGKTLAEIRDHFMGISSAAEDTGAAIDAALERPRTVPVDFEYNGDPWNEQFPGSNPNGYAKGGVVMPFRRPVYAANGFWAPQGTDTVPAMLTPGEGVLSRRGMRALAMLNHGGPTNGGNTYNIAVHANNRDGGREAAEAFVTELRRRGVKLAGVA